jgi:hypothetical protein
MLVMKIHGQTSVERHSHLRFRQLWICLSGFESLRPSLSQAKVVKQKGRQSLTAFLFACTKLRYSHEAFMDFDGDLCDNSCDSADGNRQD